ncbi:hypothetical protein CNR22_05060 [Sphingobacteriaceae bacterium]|nr:hypothetical protein CNR22_05060 [Sphingobacteriaceae bacterium]
MILNLNRLFAYSLTHAVNLCLLACFFACNACYAQDTISFESIEISARKIELSQVGKKTETIDSLAKEQFKYTSLADLLSYNSSVFIKSYGPGQLATTAFRGGNASQTAILWNGFNLQNAMLGQSDLALIPSFLFENITIEYGGSSSLWGSGAIGGSIHLKTNSVFGEGVSSLISLGAASFGAANIAAGFLVSKKRFVSSTKVYMNNSRNDFKYRDTLDKENPDKRQKDAEYNFKGLMQEFKFLVNSKQLITVNAWVNTNQRHLPNYTSLYRSKTYQRDDAMRLTGNWTYADQKFKSIIRGAYFIDKINYDDSISQIFSKSKARTLMLENENYFNLGEKSLLSLAATVLSSSANADNYSDEKSLSRVSLVIGNKTTFFKDKLLTYISARAEYFSVGTLPVTGNMALDYKLTKSITVKLNAAKVYRQPTLNELYWLPGGNINLNPEQGFTYEGALSYSKQLKAFYVFVSGSAYSRMIDNWILWVPGANGNPSPVNIQKVWSRGTETSWKLSYHKNKFRTGVAVITAYVLSTVELNAQLNDNTRGKQLIYTPRYTLNGSLFAGYENFDLSFYNQYAGYRFTSSDNLNWLQPYTISSLRANYKLNFKDISANLFIACNNIFNKNYQVMAGRSTPLRNYEIGISLKTKPIMKNAPLKDLENNKNQ